MSLDVSNPEGIATGLEAGPKVDERDTTMHIDYELVVTERALPVPVLVSGSPPSRIEERSPTIKSESPRPTRRVFVRKSNHWVA
jgi:hypothetical protein